MGAGSTRILFVGPTVPAAVAGSLCPGVELRGPAAQGDIARAVRQKPLAIGLIDGFFARVPAVWHKEILFALSQGIPVLGAASMGALRAAELAAFGMQGIGGIYRSFASGQLTRDDEVTLLHGPAELGWPALSEALVNIRATLGAAQQQGLLTRAEADSLLAALQAVHYSERSWEGLEAAAQAQLEPARAEAFCAWLPAGRVDQKRRDGEALCRALAAILPPSDALDGASDGASNGAPHGASAGARPDWTLAHTDSWDAVLRRSGRAVQASSQVALPLLDLLDEVRLADHAEETLTGALARALAHAIGREPVTAPLLQAAAQRFFAERGLSEGAAIADWMEAQGLDRAGLTRFLTGQAELHRAGLLFEEEQRRHLIAQLRAEGRYRALAARARGKRALLEAHGMLYPEASPDTAAPDAGEEGEAWRRGFRDAAEMRLARRKEAFFRARATQER